MKRSLLVFALAAIVSLCPAYAGALPIDVTLTAGYDNPYGSISYDSGSTWGLYYLDYRVAIDGMNDGDFIYGTFCLEADTLLTTSPVTYTLTPLYDDPDYLAAAWIAENYLATQKDDAQVAIWEIMMDEAFNLSGGIFRSTYDTASVYAIYDAYASAAAGGIVLGSNWVVAVNESYQDFLVNVPEPPSILLLGMGMIGLAGVGRRFRKN